MDPGARGPRPGPGGVLTLTIERGRAVLSRPLLLFIEIPAPRAQRFAMGRVTPGRPGTTLRKRKSDKKLNLKKGSKAQVLKETRDKLECQLKLYRSWNQLYLAVKRAIVKNKKKAIIYDTKGKKLWAMVNGLNAWLISNDKEIKHSRKNLVKLGYRVGKP